MESPRLKAEVTAGGVVTVWGGARLGHFHLPLLKLGVIPAQAGAHLEIIPQPQGGWGWATWRRGEDLEMGPGLRRGDIGGDVGAG